MSIETKKMTGDVMDLFKLIVIAAGTIVVAFWVINSLVGDVPAYVGYVIIGLYGVYLYATNKKIREHINNWLSGKK